jgi:hypothetical protein
MKLIGLTGLAGSGKDTIASVLLQEYNYQKLSFADTLKDVLSSMFGWDRFILEGTTEENRAKRTEIDSFWSSKLNTEITMRSAMTSVGTDLFRKFFNENIWVFSCERKLQDKELVVVTDVRFPNEIDMIRRNGGIIIEVQRHLPLWYSKITPQNKYNYMKINHPEVHISEYAWIFDNNPDYVLQNTSSITDLEIKVRNLLKSI